MSVMEDAGFPMGGTEDPKYMVLQVGASGWKGCRCTA
jgi:hypothetical protein